jgi:long-subunit fatty acid transport protein
VTNTVNNVSYTPITPHTRTAGNVTMRVQPLANISLENSFSASRASLADNRFHNSVRIAAATLSYVWNERVSVFGGFSYGAYYAEGEIEYARGVQPSSFLRNQEIHRVWQAGLDVKPIHSIGFRASGNYDRLTGAGVIDGEPPAYGPLRWPIATATLYFDCA